MPVKDIFICHASEDKEVVARPMARAFDEASVSYWYDEAEIGWGDSITQKVNEGLSVSRYVIVVLSPAFVHKNWPQRELNAVLNIEASSGEVKVLPLLVGSKQEKADILSIYPLLNDKQYLSWDGNPDRIVKALKSRLAASRRNIQHASGKPLIQAFNTEIPLPDIKKKFTQRDKDMYLRQSFGVVKTYFQNALIRLERHDKDVETDFAEVHNFKFVSTIYLQGKVASRCKIWLGGLTSSDSIAYYAGQSNIDADNTYNDLLSVEDDGKALGFIPSGMWIGGQQHSKGILTAEQAAEYLWRRLTEPLG